MRIKYETKVTSNRYTGNTEVSEETRRTVLDSYLLRSMRRNSVFDGLSERIFEAIQEETSEADAYIFRVLASAEDKLLMGSYNYTTDTE
jgi:hypothetical protein